MRRNLLAILLVLALTLAMPFSLAVAEEKVELNLLHFHTPETMDNNVENRGYHVMKEKFLAEHPNVVLNESTLQQADYHTKMMALAAANEMPDIFFTKGSWVQNFYDNNLLADLSGALDTSDYREGIFTPFTRDGKIVGSPIQLAVTSLVYWNEAMFADIGYDHFPTTWDELLDANAKFKEKGVTMIALGNKDKWPFESCIISTLGDRFTGTDWTQSIIMGDGNAKFTDPEFIETLTYSQAMAPMFNIDFNAINNEQADNLYGTGKAAATIEGMWTISYFMANADEEVIEDTRIAVLPTVPGMKGEANAVSGGAGWSQSVSSKLEGKALEMALEYVKVTTGVGYAEYLMEDSGMLSQCEVPVADKESLPILSQRYLDFMTDAKLVPIYDIQMDGAVIDVMNSKIQELLGGTATPQAVAEAIQAEQDKLG
jgi:raffinose/stachyose/melibiose transport system substrate-binding protein